MSFKAILDSPRPLKSGLVTVTLRVGAEYYHGEISRYD